MNCPRCERPLKGKSIANGMVWACGVCSGTAIGNSLLQGIAKADFMPALWTQFREEGFPGEAKCPSCPKPMRRLKAELQGAKLDLDACLTCMLLWFDRGELEQVRLKAREHWPQDQINYESYRPAWTGKVSYQQRCMHLLMSLNWL